MSALATSPSARKAASIKPDSKMTRRQLLHKSLAYIATPKLQQLDRLLYGPRLPVIVDIALDQFWDSFTLD